MYLWLGDLNFSEFEGANFVGITSFLSHHEQIRSSFFACMSSGWKILILIRHHTRKTLHESMNLWYVKVYIVDNFGILGRAYNDKHTDTENKIFGFVIRYIDIGPNS